MNVSIRPVEKADAGALLEALLESIDEVGRWMTWCTPDYGEFEAELFVDYALAGWRDGSHYEFVIEKDGVLVGVVGINQLLRADRVANLGYWIRTSLAGQGIVTRAVELAMDFAWEQTSLNRLEIVVAEENTPSRRVAEKVEAIFEGIQHDRLCIHGVPHDAAMYALLRLQHHIR